MLFRRSQRLLDFRTQRIGDLAQSVVSRRDGYDHVALDMGASMATGLRICKDLVGPERDVEVSRYVAKSVLSVVMRKLRPKKSMAVMFDGSDPLWKARKIRKVAHKKAEGRFHRSAASPLPFTVEERCKFALSEASMPPSEYLISGPAAPGPVEAKMSAWGLDLASRADITRGDTIALMGGSDMYLTALALTPFHNVNCLSLDRGEFKMTTLGDVLAWHGVDGALKAGDNVRLSRARTDLTLIHLLAGGCSATELGGVSGLVLKDLLEAYLADNYASNNFLTSDEPGTGRLLVSAAALDKLLSRVTRCRADLRGRPDIQSADVLEVLLQSLAAHCDGGIKNYGFIPQSLADVTEKSAPLQAQSLILHLRSLKGAQLAPSVDRTAAMTATEQLLVGSLQAEWVTQTIPAFTGGHGLLPGMAEAICAIDDVKEALEKTRDVLKVLDPSVHRALSHQPSHLWARTAGEPGPPPGFKHSSVCLGLQSEQLKTRATINAASATGVHFEVKKQNALVGFDAATRTWKEEDTTQPGAGTPLKQLTVVNWNVQFNRFSGQTTPLGKPGIDWCTATRYVALAKVLSTTDADVICMQEVEAPWWEFLARQPWVQENYKFSTAAKGESITPWGTLLLVHKRVPVANMTIANIPGYTGHTSCMPSCIVQLKPNVTLNVGAIHLLAPFNQSNVNVRVTQIETLMKRLAPKIVGEDVVVTGDFNDYPSNFFVMPAAMGAYRDAWVEVHGDNDGDKGWTINGRTSAYTNLIIEPEFFGRADRLLVKSKHLKAVDATLLGTRPVREELGITTCPQYLFPSDHYGIKIKMDVI